MSQISKLVLLVGTPVATITGDAGGAVGADGVGNIDLQGTAGANITVTGTPASNLLEIAVTGTTQHTVQVGDATGSLDSLAVGGNNTVLLGNAAADPSWGTVGNAALTNSSVTLSDGNNITVTGSPLSLGGTASFNLTGTTQHAVQVGDATGSLDSLAVGGNNTVLLGNAAADPSWGTVGNAALTNSSVTLSDGNNITVTGSPLSLGGTASFNLTGSTQYSLQLGNATGSLDSLGVAANGQIPIGSVGVNPVLAVPTNGTNITWTAGAGSLQADLVATVGVALGGTGVTAVTAHALVVGDTANPLNELAVGATNEVLLGNNAADPSWGAVPNAALANSSVTLSDGNNITVTGSPLSLGGTASFNLTGTTQYCVQIGDATGSLDSLATGTATQMLQSGGAAANPAWSTATYPATTTQGDVIYSSANNTVAGLAKDANATRYLANTGAANNPAWDQVELTNGVSGTLPVTNGGTGVATFTTAYAVVCAGTTATNPLQPTASAGNAGEVLTSNGAAALPSFQAISGGMAWENETGATKTMVVDTGYVANRAAGVLAFTLPASAAVGEVLAIAGSQNGWTIAQNAGQTIHFLGADTTTGAGGSVASTTRYDCIELVCIVTDNDFVVRSATGNLILT